MDNQMERRWLSLFVENRAGVLARTELLQGHRMQVQQDSQEQVR